MKQLNCIRSMRAGLSVAAMRRFSFNLAGSLLFVAMMLPQSVWAATCTSNASGDWARGNVWQGCGVVAPTAGATVNIGAGTTILADANTSTVGNITINAGGTLQGLNGATISLAGNFTNNGTFTAGGTGATGGLVSFVGTTMQTISGAVTFSNLTLNNPAGATISGSVVVTGVFTPGSTPITVLAGSTLVIGGLTYTGPCSGVYGVGYCGGGGGGGAVTCGPLPSAWPAMAGSQLRTYAGVTVNGLAVAAATSNGSFGLSATTGAPVATGAVTYPTLSPSAFPGFAGGGNLTSPLTVAGGTTAAPATYGTITVNAVAANPDTAFTGGTYYINTLTVNNNAVVSLAAGDYYINTLNIGTSVTWNISSGPVRIFVNSTFNSGGAGATGWVLNSGGSAANLQFYVYPGVARFQFGAGANFTGVVYAPDPATRVYFGTNGGAGGTLTGALISAGRSRLYGNTVVNYSAAVQAQVASVTTCAGGGTAAPGAFNAFETATAAGVITGVIQTKVAGASFSIDLVALNTAKTAVLNTFNGTVKVELLANATPGAALDAANCPVAFTSIQPPLFGTNPTLTSGRSTVIFPAIANAWQDVRVRVSYPATGTATAVACSSDNFALRPSSLANLVVSDTNWTSAGARILNNASAAGPGCSAVGTPVGCAGNIHKAGQPFTVSAVAVNAAAATTTNYTGTPSAILTACAGTACTPTFGAFAVGATAVGGVINSAAATYSEVGSFNLQLQDQTFANVDIADGSTTAQRYISSAVINVGRFVPDHFDVAYNTPALAPGIVSVTDSFTYIGQPFGFGVAPILSVVAKNALATPTVTANYTGALWKLTKGTNGVVTDFVSSQGWADASAGCASCLPVVLNGGVALALPSVLAAAPGSGIATFAVGAGLNYTRPSSPVVPFNALLMLSGSLGADGDGVAATIASYQFNAVGFTDNNAATLNDAQMRYGRIKLNSALGSALLRLPVTMTAQYWNAASSYVASATDSSTSFVVATPPGGGAVSFANYQKNLTTISVVGSPKTVVLLNGVGGYILAAPGPGNNGSVDMSIPALTGASCNVVPIPLGCYLPSNTARATFGVYKGSNEFIYQRENY